MVNINSAAALGLLRTVASVVVFSVVLAILGFFADATHLHGVVNDGLAGLIAAVAGAAEASWAAKNSTALFGAIAIRK